MNETPTIDTERMQTFAHDYAITDKTGYTAPFVAFMVIGGTQLADIQEPSGFFAKRTYRKELDKLTHTGIDMIKARVDKIFEQYTIDGQPGVAIPQEVPADKRPGDLKNAEHVVAFCTLAETTPDDMVSLCGRLAVASADLKKDIITFAKARELKLTDEVALTVGGYLWVPATAADL